MNSHIKNVGAVLWSTLIAVSFGGTCLALYFKEIPVSQKDIALVLLGALISEMKGVGSFWTGSTNSSQSKDQTIAELSKKVP